MKKFIVFLSLALLLVGSVFSQNSEIIVECLDTPTKSIIGWVLLNRAVNHQPFFFIYNGSNNNKVRLEKVANGTNKILITTSKPKSPPYKTRDVDGITVVSDNNSITITCRIDSKGKISDVRVASSVSYFDTIRSAIEKGDYSVAKSEMSNHNISADTLLTKELIKRNPDTNVIHFLLENEANLNVRDRNGDTVLIREAKKENINFDLIKFLVENGANLNLRNEKGDTAASIAYDKGEVEVYDYLKTNGARDFEPKVVQQQAPASAPITTNNYYSEPAREQSSTSSPTVTKPKTQLYSVTVWYLDENRNRKSMPFIKNAESKSDAEREAERDWKNGPMGFSGKYVFLESVAN